MTVDLVRLSVVCEDTPDDYLVDEVLPYLFVFNGCSLTRGQAYHIARYLPRPLPAGVYASRPNSRHDSGLKFKSVAATIALRTLYCLKNRYMLPMDTLWAQRPNTQGIRVHKGLDGIWEWSPLDDSHLAKLGIAQALG